MNNEQKKEQTKLLLQRKLESGEITVYEYKTAMRNIKNREKVLTKSTNQNFNVRGARI